MAENDKLFLVTRYLSNDDGISESGSHTNTLLYSPSREIAADITFLLSGRPNLYHPAEVHMLPDEKAELLKQYVTPETTGEGKVKGYYANEIISFREIVGEYNTSIIEALAKSKEARMDLGELLSSAGVVKQKTEKPRSGTKPIPPNVTPIDPFILDQTTKDKLERIINDVAGGNSPFNAKKYFKARFSEATSAPTAEKDDWESRKSRFEYQLSLEECCNELHPDKILKLLDEGEREGFLDQQSRAEKELGFYHEIYKSRDADAALYFVQKLHLDEKFPENIPSDEIILLKCDRLRMVMICGYSGYLGKEFRAKNDWPKSYLEWVKRAAEGLTSKAVESLATEAYTKIMKSFQDGSDYSYRAGMLVKEYSDDGFFGNKKLLEVGKKMVEKHSNLFYIVGDVQEKYIQIDREFSDLELPEELTKPVWLSILSGAAESGFPQVVQQVRQKHPLSDEEIGAKINPRYAELMRGGSFSSAYRLREQFPALIQDERVAFDDLKTLVGVTQYIDSEETKKRGKPLEL